MKRLKILYLFPFGGTEVKYSKHVMGNGFLRQLVNRGHSVYVIPSSEAERALAKLLGCTAFDIDRASIIGKVFQNGLFVSFANRRVKQLAELAREHQLDVIFERHTLFNIGYYVSKLTKIPYVTNEVIVYPDIPYYGTRFEQLQMRLLSKSYYKRIEQVAFCHARAIIANKEIYINTLCSEYGVELERVFRFYAMVDKESFTPGDKGKACECLGLDASRFRVVYAGTFDRLHTPEHLVPVIQCMSNLNIQFVLVGDGPRIDMMKERLKCFIESGKVIFTGRVEHVKVIKYIQASDVCVESIWSDRARRMGADSIKFYEYMACGKPIVASDLPGQIQDVKREGGAILVDPTDTIAFVSAIRELYENESLREEMGRRARRMVEEKWNWDYTMEVVEKALYYAAKTGNIFVN